jgi:hypothetical protein
MSRPHRETLAISFDIDVHRRERALANLVAVLQRGRPNVLVIGDSASTTDALERMRPYLQTPIASWLARESPALPEPPYRTLLIRDVDQLAVGQQTDLLAQLDEACAGVQLVSLAGTPLFPAVVRGAFLENLYYRLNIVVLDCAAAGRRVHD